MALTRDAYEADAGQDTREWLELANIAMIRIYGYRNPRSKDDTFATSKKSSVPFATKHNLAYIAMVAQRSTPGYPAATMARLPNRISVYISRPKNGAVGTVLADIDERFGA